MARTLIARLNIGLDDQKKYGIPDSDQGNKPPREGDTLTVEDDQLADILVNKLKCCDDYDASAEEEHARQVREKDERVMDRRVASQVALQQAEDQAKERMMAKSQQLRSGPQRSMQGPSQPAKVNQPNKPSTEST